jgi:hypothetical protein
VRIAEEPVVELDHVGQVGVVVKVAGHGSS